MKKVIIVLSSTVFIIVAAYLLMPNIMMNSVKDKIIENNPDIENIVTINHISSWGEWFLEYVLVVEIGGQKFRIWSNDKGEITDKEALISHSVSERYSL
ncbi:hypothetical protein DCE79_12055 [Lysinibacillus sp. 2017]|uniref:hypothetical protein n=1 Tax=unclassified Lysinibacillus TaxID=2636778 RepID=UPI000D529206|nr:MULTISPECIES: hypothetical protein [unclassified Lysinibacillus]AWE08075.1 hypothetical protein DCE79_12055 [Lysinibacillus sp. 2017]TGN36420.1 hypothetical protein E4L99_05885 [Lysinibacillus sp. S2017]